VISPRRWLKLAETHSSICYKLVKWYNAIVLKLVGLEVEENDEIITKQFSVRCTQYIYTVYIYIYIYNIHTYIYIHTHYYLSVWKNVSCTGNLEGMYLVSECELAAGSCTETHRPKLLYIVGHETQPG
jgi:hypothetical protein